MVPTPSPPNVVKRQLKKRNHLIQSFTGKEGLLQTPQLFHSADRVLVSSDFFDPIALVVATYVIRR